MSISPLRSLIRRQAVAKGFPDPMALLDRLSGFAEPSEVAYPVELLRAGAKMHERGLFNSAILQYNTDWKWPYWINRQFDPDDKSFVPRAFSLTYINLTHRNWVAVGLPDIGFYPLVDPEGLLTPYWDGWSLDVWSCDTEGRWHTAQDASSVEQHLDFSSGLAVHTVLQFAGYTVTLRVCAQHTRQGPVCRLDCGIEGASAKALAVSVRPANPEGIAFVHTVERRHRGEELVVDDVPVSFSRKPEVCFFSDYRQGDVFHQLRLAPHEANGRSCPQGMVTAAAVFRCDTGGGNAVSCTMPLCKPEQDCGHHATQVEWREALHGSCHFQIPDRHFQYLTDAALHSLVLLAPDEIYPGSFTYKRFWFRDATYMVSALLSVGCIQRARTVLSHFIRRQQLTGYFRSQEGEWDSNGQVLWIFAHYFAVTGERPERTLLERLIRGGEWIRNKRLRKDPTHANAGLLPAGFSAEHLGPNDYYYWDDFWSVAGLRALARLCADAGDTKRQQSFEAEADDLMRVIEESLRRAAERHGRAAIPAAPLRRLDAAVIGSIVASYPLRLFDPDDERLHDTLDYLREHCLVRGTFYQQMIHSGINAYLTLQLAQAALRSGDGDHFSYIRNIAAMATPVGQWPEAIHPRTGGGCMGDGQHGWAAAEWLLMMRNLFVREEGDAVILASGIPREWLQPGSVASCQGTPVEGGMVSVAIHAHDHTVELHWSAIWHAQARSLQVRLPGFAPHTTQQSSGTLQLKRA